MSIPVVYDPRYHTWDSWTSLMCEAYAEQQLAIGIPEVDWKSWADGMNAIGYFLNSGTPDSRNFDNWQDWAQALAGIVNVDN